MSNTEEIEVEKPDGTKAKEAKLARPAIAQERLEALLVDMKTSNPAGYTALYGQLRRLVVQRYTEKQDNTKRKK